MSSTRWPLWMLLLTAPAALRAGEPPQAELDFFEQRIRPVLVERCYECHSGQSASLKGGLRLDTRPLIRKGGDSGPAVVPGDGEASLLLQAIRYESFEMPPDGRLPPRVIADFERWIAAGAADPRDGTAVPAARGEADLQAAPHWSFQPPRRHALPEAARSNWVRRPLDAFVLARMQEAGLRPNREADRRVLVRRVTFDLTGLPPTPREVAEFLADTSPHAYERLVERLLASPQYGERWARVWLDVARYGEDQAHIVGNNKSLFYPNAYLYRDWVIEAWNRDLSYDRFLQQQLAADLLAPDDREQHAALGFLGLGPKYYRRNAPEVMADEWEDRVDTVCRGLLGLTVACARCHDHKYDPIPTEDYYALAGVFASTKMFNRPLDGERETKDDGQAKEPEDAVHVVAEAEARDLPVYIRGDVKNEGPVAPRRFLQILESSKRGDFRNGSGRRALADSITNPANPLTARVLVNRIWGHFFGRPLVATPSNFGRLGQPPTHPRLLDDLAVRFMESGWSVKWLQREIALSATYRQSSRLDPEKENIDEGNQSLWRMNRRRLSVEQWRDAVLSVAGRMDRRIGGESMQPQAPDERRRTVYSYVSRLELDALLSMFDFPDPNVHSGWRTETTTPLQKLFVLNSPFMVQQTDALALRLMEHGDDTGERIEFAYQLLFARPPRDVERRIGEAFLKPDELRQDPLSAWRQYVHMLLASNEFLMLD